MYPGDVIKIPPGAIEVDQTAITTPIEPIDPTATPVGTSTTVAVGAGGTYEVVAGDALSVIASKNGTTMEAIIDANGWTDGIDHVIYPGRKSSCPLKPADLAEVWPAALLAAAKAAVTQFTPLAQRPLRAANRCIPGRSASGSRLGSVASCRPIVGQRLVAEQGYGGFDTALNRRVFSPSAAVDWAAEDDDGSPRLRALHALAEDRARSVDEHWHHRRARCGPDR